LCVGGDHEVFNSADEFLADVTPEGLQQFESISIRTVSLERVAEVTLRWKRPWWKPGMSPDGEVLVELTGEAQWRAEARRTINAALRRGNGRIGSGTAVVLVGGGAAIALASTAVSLGYLLKVDSDVTLYVAILAWLSGLVGGAFGGTWAIPALEIAPEGHTKIRRIVRFVGPIVLAIAIAGVTKKLFG
jgi:hypothetical protein